MTRRNTQEAYRREFRRKLRAARISSGKGPEEIAHSLGISLDSYLRYESRYMMPHDLIVEFCKITGMDVGTLLAPPKKRRPALHSVK